MKKTSIIAAVLAGACTFAATNDVVVVDKTEARAKADAAQKAFRQMSAEEQAKWLAEREARRKAVDEANAKSPKRIVKRVDNPDGTITVTRADGTVTTYKYIVRSGDTK